MDKAGIMLKPFLERILAVIEAGMEGARDARRMVDSMARHQAMQAPCFHVKEPRILPVCDHLGSALRESRGHEPRTAMLADAFADLAPSLVWQLRAGAAAQGDSFLHGHANALIIGHGDYERPEPVTLGVSLLAPGVTYPDHAHPPEELYVVLSPGKWRQNRGAWMARDAGDLVHNPPGINHGMQAGAGPLLALWLLWRK